MSRRKAIADDVVLDGILNLMRRSGPERVTFAAVGSETGLSGASLVQRFGSKPAMVQAALLRAWDGLDALTRELDQRSAETPSGAVDLLVGLSRAYGDGEAYVEGLVLLREDLRDPVLRRRGEAWGGTLAAALGRRLDRHGSSRSVLGRMMASQWQGALLWWGFERKKPVEEEIAETLTAWCKAMRLV
ncbi:MAG TPA: TetR family transcriptional regulator [Alphaproteobacteria bacterium]|nr:TetR family transcriptional regulator [Alphaproteobacteria bacterium]